MAAAGDARAISSAAGMLWVGTRPSARAAPASRQPATSTRPARARAGAPAPSPRTEAAGAVHCPGGTPRARAGRRPRRRARRREPPRVAPSRRSGRGCGTAPGPVAEGAAEVVQEDDRAALAERRGIAPEPHRVAEPGGRGGDRVRAVRAARAATPRAGERRWCRAARSSGIAAQRDPAQERLGVRDGGRPGEHGDGRSSAPDRLQRLLAGASGQQVDGPPQRRVRDGRERLQGDDGIAAIAAE